MPFDFFTVLTSGRSFAAEPAAVATSSPGTHPSTVSGSCQSRTENVKIVGYHNALLPEDSPLRELPPPPTYSDAQRYTTSRPSRIVPLVPEGREQLPIYQNSVAKEAILGMKLEMINPFESFEQPHWAEVYIVLRGTVLNIHQVKTASFLSKVKNPDRAPTSAGKLLKSYSLQHAEVGIAADHEKFELVARSHLTEMLPEAALQQLKITDPALFYPVRQYVIRLRLETGQFLLRVQTAKDMTDWILQICAAIDIAPPIDDRTEPRYHTLPRRRRRNQIRRVSAILNNADSVQEQERLFRQHYPHLLNTVEQEAVEPKNAEVEETISPSTMENPDLDAEDLDMNALRNGPDTPAEEQTDPMEAIFSPTTTSDLSPASAGNVSSATFATLSIDSGALSSAATDFDGAGKWQPQHNYGPAQELRLQRRCLPSLCYNSRRASNIVFHGGKRYEIDYERRVLIAWPAPPPKYILSSTTATEDHSLNRVSDDTNSNYLSASPTSSRPQSMADNGLIRVPTSSSTTSGAPNNRRPYGLSRNASSMSTTTLSSTTSIPPTSPTTKKSWRSRFSLGSRKNSELVGTEYVSDSTTQSIKFSQKGTQRTQIPTSDSATPLMLPTLQINTTAPPSPVSTNADTDDAKSAPSSPADVHPALRSAVPSIAAVPEEEEEEQEGDANADAEKDSDAGQPGVATPPLVTERIVEV